MKNNLSAAIACMGAVIGAGFASGREIATFFTQYGESAWWLILLCVAVMASLCWLCMRSAQRYGASQCWCALFEGNGTGAQICTTLLMVITAGAMIGAAGELTALMWAGKGAYWLGAVGTLMAAWGMGRRRLRSLGWLSGCLTALLLCAMVLAMACVPETESTALHAVPLADGWAAMRAAGYAAMNITLAIGVVCRCSDGAACVKKRCLLFGGLMAVLLYTANALYLRHPEVLAEPFPIVQLLRCFGRDGFLVSVTLLYLAVFTTLTAVLYALNGAVSVRVRTPWSRAVVWGLPLLASCMGFSGIVGGLYAPAGWLCLLLVYAPLAAEEFRARRMQRKA